MNTEEALRQLGVTELALRPEEKKSLDEQGYFIAPDVFTPEEVAEMKDEVLRLRELEGELGGHEVHIEPGAPRLSNLFNKSGKFDRCLACRPTLAAAHYLLGEIKVYSLNSRSPLKGQGQQPLHSDVPRRFRGDWWMVNSMVMLDDLTDENGPTRVVPESHKWAPLNVPDVNMWDVTHIDISPEERAHFPEDPLATYPTEVKIKGKAGSVAVINGALWHGGTVNLSGNTRWVLHLAIGRRDVPQQFVEREHLGRNLFDRSGAAQKFLLDIEGAEPAYEGYPPLPKQARTWAAAQEEDGHYKTQTG